MLKKIIVSPLLQILLLTAFVFAAMLSALMPLENANFDLWSSHFRRPVDQPIAIVAIDEKSVARIGDWPWSRDRIAEMARLLSTHQAAAQGICLLFAHPDLNPGLDVLESLREQISAEKWPGDQRTLKRLEGMLDHAKDGLDHDGRLIQAVRQAKNVVLPLYFRPGTPNATDAEDLTGVLIIHSMNAQSLPVVGTKRPWLVDIVSGDQRHLPMAAGKVRVTFDDLATKAGALGHLNLDEDSDGTLRRVPLLVDYKGRLFASLALQLTLKHLNTNLRALAIDLDFLSQPTLRIKHVRIDTDEAFHMLIGFDRQWTREHTYSFVDLIDGSIDPAIVKNKIVLIGPTADTIGQHYRVGAAGRASNVEIQANILARALSTARLSRPSWARLLEITALFYFAFFLIFVIPRVQFKVGLAILVVFAATWYVMTVGLMLGYGYWIHFFGPVLLGGSGFLLIQWTNFSRKRQQEKADANKTLGLTYQGQGMLDMAYEKYMQCAITDASVKNLLYSLALDFERKRMFNKALAIYRHIRTAGAFKDVDKRCERLQPLDNTIGMGPAAGRGETPLLMDDTNAMPTFGRYQLVKELGHGAMGTVYLGRDPKINREVAIKTLDYTEVETDELPDIKARFFREAEAAGKLSHPNIVSIYDVGEEHDMAYIAMELLQGETLDHYCKNEHLQPFDRVLTIIAEVAAALAYAHGQGVIHRDIKPANIMLLADGRAKVTDFGIARVVDASQTRTGVILGSPNYMSPEQVSCDKLDGRSDLFSMGIVLYELLAGAKPFKGDSISTILYAINHNAHTPIAEHRTGVPPCCETIVNKLLAKKPARRYKSADEALKAIRACLTELQ